MGNYRNALNYQIQSKDLKEKMDDKFGIENTLRNIAIIYISILALAQKNIKKLIAYSSIAHMGFVTLGIFSKNLEGLQGAVFQMISHGLISSALFLYAGFLIDRVNTKEINNFGGIWKKMPFFSSFFLVFCLGAISFPGTSGFISEFLILIGVFKISFFLSFFAAFGIIFSACYILWMYNRICFGENNQIKVVDLSLKEIFVSTIFLFLILLFGFQPNILLGIYELSTNKLIF